MPHIDLGTPVSRLVDWLTLHLAGLFSVISTVMLALLNAVLWLLTAPHELLMVAIFVGLALAVRRWGLALFALVAFLLIQAMGLWVEAMQTLAVVLVASLLAVLIGVPIGIWAARSRAVSNVVRPVLDFMQTLPVFVYLIPAVFFFGIGVVPGVMATLIFAIPPAVRMTELGIRNVDEEVVEAAHAFGAKPGQILREAQLPLALPSIMAGVNQTIMLALSMVVIAGLVGAAGLGVVVVRGISTLDVGAGFQGGLAVVLIAIYLDRLTGAFAESGGGLSWLFRRRHAATAPGTAATAQAPGGSEAAVASEPATGATDPTSTTTS